MFEEWVRESTVDGRVYTSPEVFAAEIERIFARCWNYLGHLSEIPETGGQAQVPYTIKEGQGLRFRTPDGAEQAQFPESIYREPNPADIEDYKD